MDSKQLGDLGEKRAQLEFVKKGYEIYLGSANNYYYDFIAHSCGVLKRVEVKATTRRNKSNTGWVFDIRKEDKQKPFDNKKVDFLCCYIHPLDKLLIIPSKSIKTKREYLVLDKDIS